jgi:hypothetical protein
LMIAKVQLSAIFRVIGAFPVPLFQPSTCEGSPLE